MILSGSYTCIAHADRIHRTTGYDGQGAYDFASFECHFPEFHFVGVPRRQLPRGIEAVSRRDSSGVLIIYAEETHRERLRFTIAHEIGHALMHAPDVARLRSRRSALSPEEAKIEAQADFFAAELLMPAWAIDRSLPSEWSRGRARAADFEPEVRRLAALFCVSRAAMRIQLEGYLRLAGSTLSNAAPMIDHLR